MQIAFSFNEVIGVIGLGFPQLVGNRLESFYARIGACRIVEMRIVFAVTAQRQV